MSPRGDTVGDLGRCVAQVFPRARRDRLGHQCVRNAVLVVRGTPLCWQHRRRGAATGDFIPSADRARSAA